MKVGRQHHLSRFPSYHPHRANGILLQPSDIHAALAALPSSYERATCAQHARSWYVWGMIATEQGFIAAMVVATALRDDSRGPQAVE